LNQFQKNSRNTEIFQLAVDNYFVFLSTLVPSIENEAIESVNLDRCMFDYAGNSCLLLAARIPVGSAKHHRGPKSYSILF
jgi:hypothetical protein